MPPPRSCFLLPNYRPTSQLPAQSLDLPARHSFSFCFALGHLSSCLSSSTQLFKSNRIPRRRILKKDAKHIQTIRPMCRSVVFCLPFSPTDGRRLWLRPRSILATSSSALQVTRKVGFQVSNFPFGNGNQDLWPGVVSPDGQIGEDVVLDSSVLPYCIISKKQKKTIEELEQQLEKELEGI